MKYFLMIFMSVLLLTACGTAEEDAAEESTDEGSAEAEEDVTEDEGAEAEGSTEPADGSGDAAEEDETETEPSRNVDFSVTEEALTDEEGSEMTSMLELNSELVEMLGSASESEADVSEVLKPAEDLTTYYSEAFVAIHVFQGDASEPMNSDVEGMNAEMDVRQGTEAYSEYYNTAIGEFEEYLYRNEDGYYGFDGNQWVDAPELSAGEDIYYGSYTNLHDAFMDTEDVINVSEDDDYYYLHNIGNEEVLHETFGNVFNVEYTGADESAMENAVVAAVNKSTGEMDELLYITTAPSEAGDESLQIEVAVSFDGYGAFDDEGVTVPDIEESDSSPDNGVSVGNDQNTVDNSLTDESITGDDGTEMTSISAMNADVVEMLENVSETDENVEDILKQKDDVGTYYAEAFVMINIFDGVNSEPVQSDMTGLIAEVDEREDIEVYAEVHDPASDEFVPHRYGNPDSVFAYEDGMWSEVTSGTTTGEIFHATYSTVYDAFLEMEDIMDVGEDDEHYYLYNIGTEMVLHEEFGEMFNVEYTGADEDAMENAVVGVVDKSNGELVHLVYISTAPAEQGDEYLQIEVASTFGGYGEYDDTGITVPDIYE